MVVETVESLKVEME